MLKRLVLVVNKVLDMGLFYLNFPVLNISKLINLDRNLGHAELRDNLGCASASYLCT
jgi:hypothetical protein